MWASPRGELASANCALRVSLLGRIRALLWLSLGMSAKSFLTARAILWAALPCHGPCCNISWVRNCGTLLVLSIMRATSFVSSGPARQQGCKRLARERVSTTSLDLSRLAVVDTLMVTLSYVHKELTKKICGLADPRMDRTVRAGLMGVACGSVQLSDKSKTFINSVLGRQIKRPDLEAFLRIPSTENRSIASLRADCTQVLLTDAKPHLADLPPPYHELGPTMKLVLGMWLPHLSLERLVDMLGYQFLAMASEAEIEEEPSEQYHYPEQAAVKRAATPVAIKPGTHTWPICLLHRVYPRASVMLLTPELADVPDWATKWFAVAGKVPAKGTALLVTLREDKGDVAYPGMFIELLAPKKLSTGPGESKAMQPVNITIALLLTDEQHNQFAQRPSLPRVSQLEVLPGGASTPLWDALLHIPRERQHVALGVPLEDSPLDAIRQPHWLPGFLTDLVLVLIIGLVVRGNWHDTWAQLIHPEVCQVFRGKHATQAAQASPTAGPGASNTLQSILNLWLAEEQTYRTEWTPTLLSGVLATLPDSPLPGQEDARTPALWHAERLRMSQDSLSNEHDPRTRASIFALAVGPAFLTCLCDTFWGADGHLAALLGACSYGLAANRTSVFITGAPGSGKTRSCAFLGVLLACLTNRLTLYTAHGNESVRAYVEAVDRLTTASNEFVRSRIVRIPGNKEKDTHKLPFDVHDLYRGLLVATTHGTIVARLSFPYSQLINRLKDVELLLRDEAQQLGTPGSNTILAHIKHALDVMIGDHRQPAGGSRPNYHFVTELLEQKTCGLNAVPADLHTPATLPAALLRQTAQSSGPWKKGQGEMPSWGTPHRSSGASEVFFSVFANGTRIEDISYYNRCSYMYGLLKNEEWWLNRHIQGFLADGGGHAAPIPASGSRTVLMSPHLIGILNCGKMLPPELNLVLQITFCDPTDGARNVSGSQDYTIENVKLYASQVTLDSALRESFQRIMTSGRSLVFSFPTIHTQLSSIPAGSTSYNIVVSRAFTKMLGAFVTFNKTTEDHVDNFEYPGANANRNLKGQLQLGALQYPRTAEWHHFLEILAGTYDSKLRNMRIRDNLFGNTQFVAAFPVERVPKHPLSGISTRSGDLCRFSFSNMEADRADQCFVHMLSYQLCTLSSAGVSSLD